MAGPVPAIGRGDVPLLMAGREAGHDGSVGGLDGSGNAHDERGEKQRRPPSVFGGTLAAAVGQMAQSPNQTKTSPAAIEKAARYDEIPDALAQPGVAYGRDALSLSASLRAANTCGMRNQSG
jgi:hypothetical protein